MKKYNKIFIKREFRSILGKKWGNFWILLLIFLTAIGALSFSRAGLEFLYVKMNDPFIQWIEVKEQKNFKQFKKDVIAQKDSFSILTMEENNYILEYVLDTNFQYIRVEGRTIAYDSELLQKILAQKGTVKRSKSIEEKDIGWIVTKEMLKNLGYTDKDNYPLFINFTFKGTRENIDHYGIPAYGRDRDFIVIPIPIIAVVERLPHMLDFITTNYFFEQLESSNNPFNISLHEKYYDDLYFVASTDIYPHLDSILNKSGFQYEIEEPESFDEAIDDALKYRVLVRKPENIEDSTFTQFYHQLNSIVQEVCAGNLDITRYYDYDFHIEDPTDPDYLSFLFSDLSKVKGFADWAFQNYEVKVEMTQIEAKENFEIFNNLVFILSWAMIIVSIFVVVIFLWFLINTHFQKISKNLGTIMAFGLENRTIIFIYLIVFVSLVFFSLISATLLLLLMQYMFGWFGFVRELNNLPYINMYDSLVLMVIFGILILSALVTYIAMWKKLKATPGDLIFDRNN